MISHSQNVCPPEFNFLQNDGILSAYHFKTSINDQSFQLNRVMLDSGQVVTSWILNYSSVIFKWLTSWLCSLWILWNVMQTRCQNHFTSVSHHGPSSPTPHFIVWWSLHSNHLKSGPFRNAGRYLPVTCEYHKNTIVSICFYCIEYWCVLRKCWTSTDNWSFAWLLLLTNFDRVHVGVFLHIVNHLASVCFCVRWHK